MILTIMVELLIAVFALVGITCAVHLIARRFFGSRHTVLAIEILTQRDAESAEELIRDALFSVLGIPSGRIIVVTTEALARESCFQELIKRYGVTCYFVQEKMKET